jgi:sphingolipid delta-4 desaturase
VTGLVEDFSHAQGQEPHRDRTKELLRNHPEMRRFIGANPYSFLVILGIVAFQLALSALMPGQNWWIMALTAFCVGAFASHALWVMIHECAHNLVFKRTWLNTLAGMLANLPHVLPSSVSFQRYHLKHHAFQGVYDLDADLPSYWEAKLIGHSTLGKAVWLMLFPIFQVTRPPRLREIRMLDPWIVVNIAVQLCSNAAVYFILGPQALLYLLLSFFFSVGLHPLGARWIQEHYLVSPPQETYSYYGPLNKVAFNVGYHNEHHDLPSIPWNHLPQVKQTAPELYDSLVFHTSWTKLLFRFLFDPNISLFSRRVRISRGGVALDTAVKPDIEFLASRT